MWPVDGGSFHVTDDAIVNFCLEEDVQIDRQEEDAAPKRRPHAELHVDNGIFTKNLFKRLIEVSNRRRLYPMSLQSLSGFYGTLTHHIMEYRRLTKRERLQG